MKQIVFNILKVFGPTFGFGLAAAEFGDTFGIDTEFLKSYGWWSLYFFVLTSLLLGVIFAFYKDHKVKSVQLALLQSSLGDSILISEREEKLSKEIVNIINNNFAKGEYSEVVRFGAPMSRPLLLSGMLEDRIIIGNKVANASGKIGQKGDRIRALIDDVGWTNALLNKPKEAIEFINQGIILAKADGDSYMAAKGTRHKGGINQRYLGLFDEAEVNYKEALDLAEQIEVISKKDEMKGGILYGMAGLYLLKNELEKALTVSKESQRIFERLKDPEREVKAYSQKGRIFLLMGKVNEAEEEFNTGYRKAKILSRIDEIGYNLKGLGLIAFKRDLYDTAIQNLLEAEEIFITLKLKKDLEEVQELLAVCKIKLNKNHE